MRASEVALTYKGKDVFQISQDLNIKICLIETKSEDPQIVGGIIISKKYRKYYGTNTVIFLNEDYEDLEFALAYMLGIYYTCKGRKKFEFTVHKVELSSLCTNKALMWANSFAHNLLKRGTEWQ